MRDPGLVTALAVLTSADVRAADGADCTDLLGAIREVRGWLDATEVSVTTRMRELHDTAGEMPAADRHARCGGVSAAEGRRKERRSKIVDERTHTTGEHRDHGVCETGSGLPVPPSSISRAMCDGRATPVIVDRQGVVLSAGRTIRSPNRAQRRALRAMYRTCAVGDCDVPFDRCEIHHIQPWELGDPTDLDNLVPCCSRHHHLVHALGWRLDLSADRTLTVTDRPGSVLFVTEPDVPPARDTRHRRRTAA